MDKTVYELLIFDYVVLMFSFWLLCFAVLCIFRGDEKVGKEKLELE